MSSSTTGAMRASIIVVAYNSRRDLGACLQSILDQAEACDEIIVVDNGSNDGSSAFVRSAFPQVRLLAGQNIGYAGGNNAGARLARGSYLVFLNPDTVLRRGALAALLAPLAWNTTIALTTACIVHQSRPHVVNTCGNTMHFTGLTYCRGAGHAVEQYRAAAEVDAVSGAAFAMRRAVFEALGGFDEQFFMYVEDSDLSLRARLAGYHCLYVPGAIVEHDYQPSYSPQKAFFLDRNRHLMLLKNLRRTTYLRMLPGLLLAEAVTAGYLLLKGPRFWGVKPRVYCWLWAQRKTIRIARRTTQQHQLRDDREVVGQMAHRLEFEQLANRWLARIAGALFHPAFRAARLLLVDGGRA